MNVFLDQLVELGKADKLLGMQILHQVWKAFLGITEASASA